LPRCEELTNGITCIDTGQTPPACCYLMRSGDQYAFIETGTAHSVPGLLALLSRRNIAPEQVRYVIPTHVHLDHASGAGALMRVLPQAKLVAHPRGARHLIDPAKLIAGASAVYGAASLQEMYGTIEPVSEARVIVADDGFRLDFNGRELLFIDAPGHARHHFAVWDAQSRGFFSGDSFGLSYREFDGPRGPFLIATTSPVQFEPEAWHATLDRFLTYQPEVMYLTHYSRVGNISRLTSELRGDIDAHVRIARQLATTPDRHTRLVAALTAHELDRLAHLECPLSEARARALLKVDMELNAQGLGAWLDRK
jgi:glyoxylase-like metal-dependent hydrolase (beta-lactamase superfamily II)